MAWQQQLTSMSVHYKSNPGCFMVVPFTGSLESCFNLKEHETLLLFL